MSTTNGPFWLGNTCSQRLLLSLKPPFKGAHKFQLMQYTLWSSLLRNKIFQANQKDSWLRQTIFTSLSKSQTKLSHETILIAITDTCLKENKVFPHSKNKNSLSTLIAFTRQGISLNTVYSHSHCHDPESMLQQIKIAQRCLQTSKKCFLNLIMYEVCQQSVYTYILLHLFLNT